MPVYRPPTPTPFLDMPTEFYQPAAYATLASGRNVDFQILHHGIMDLYDFGYLHLQDYTMARAWLFEYQRGGALPGFQRFYDPFSGTHCFFLQMLDGVFELIVAAANNEDIENDDPNPASDDEDDEEDLDLFMPLPVNIGRFGLGPAFRWEH